MTYSDDNERYYWRWPLIPREIVGNYIRLKRLLEDDGLTDAERITAAEISAQFGRLLNGRRGQLQGLGVRKPLPRVSIRPDFKEAWRDGGLETALGWFARVSEWIDRCESKHGLPGDDI